MSENKKEDKGDEVSVPTTSVIDSTHEGDEKVNPWDEDIEEYSDRITLEHVRKESLKHALYAREYLLEFDRESGSLKNIGSEISVGFPESSKKSKDRFMAQFVGSNRKQSLSGALVNMGFINTPNFAGIQLDDVHLTKIGLEFALLPNPLIDEGIAGWKEFFKSGKRFSDKEIEFLLQHFKTNVPSEWGFMRSIAQIISNGNNRPKTLEKEITVIYGWEDTKTSQMRNGALSRMEELCLIIREKKGREVTYSLTDLCNQIVLSK